MKISVLGGGSWGTAMAIHVARKGHETTLWARDSDHVQEMSRDRTNQRYLPEIELPKSLLPVGDFVAATRMAEVVLVAVPSHVFRIVARRLQGLLVDGVPVVSTSKGIEKGSLARMTEVIAEELPASPAIALSGPSFAAEVGRGEPTVAVVAGEDIEAVRFVQLALSDSRFRFYTSRDAVGVELAGALKNVIAIACGIVAGMGLGHNTTAAIITRGLAELTRLGVAAGGQPETFAGLAGVGDLILTCTGGLSRNRHVGLELGRGRDLDDILESMGQVAEGVKTTASALELASRHNVEMPVTRQVDRLLKGQISPRDAVTELMVRDLKPERE